jgi:formamidopyrimidine-DNA glycosylase
VPELPDVEHERRFLAARAAGATIQAVVVTDPGILRNTSSEVLDSALRGERFEAPGRHGKWLLGWTTGPAVLMHFGMTGTLRWAVDAGDRHRHDRVIFVTDNGELRYRNMRKLGGVWLAHDRDEVATIIGRLGPDALNLSPDGFRARLQRRRGRIKSVLMDQEVLAGVGNLIADEALWQAKIHPLRPADQLSESEISRLHRALSHVLRTAVERLHKPPRRWMMHVRGLPGARCPRCRTSLERTVVGGRTTYFCPQCQAVDSA